MWLKYGSNVNNLDGNMHFLYIDTKKYLVIKGLNGGKNILKFIYLSRTKSGAYIGNTF